MLRKRAIRSLLVEDVAGLRLGAAPEPEDDEAARERPAEPPARAQIEHEALRRAERRAALVVGFDWLALVALFVLRDPAAAFLPMDATVETIFTLGVLAVAAHSGFRLGQLEKYRAVRRAWEELAG